MAMEKVPRSTNPQDYPQWVRERVKALARKYANGHEDVVWQEFFEQVLDYHDNPRSRRMAEVFAKHEGQPNLLAYFLDVVEFVLGNPDLVTTKGERAKLHLVVKPE